MTPHYLMFGYEAASATLYNPITIKHANKENDKHETVMEMERERLRTLNQIREQMSTNYHTINNEIQDCDYTPLSDADKIKMKQIKQKRKRKRSNKYQVNGSAQ